MASLIAKLETFSPSAPVRVDDVDNVILRITGIDESDGIVYIEVGQKEQQVA